MAPSLRRNAKYVSLDIDWAATYFYLNDDEDRMRTSLLEKHIVSNFSLKNFLLENSSNFLIRSFLMVGIALIVAVLKIPFLMFGFVPLMYLLLSASHVLLCDAWLNELESTPPNEPLRWMLVSFLFRVWWTFLIILLTLPFLMLLKALGLLLYVFIYFYSYFSI